MRDWNKPLPGWIGRLDTEWLAIVLGLIGVWLVS